MPAPKKTAPARKTATRKVSARKPVQKPARKKAAKKKPSRRWLILPAISLLVIGYGFFRLLAHYSSEVDRNLHGAISRHRAVATARVIGSSGGKAPRVQFQFRYKGIPYERAQPNGDGHFRMHECYEVQFDSTSPGRALLIEGTGRFCPPPGVQQE